MKLLRYGQPGAEKPGIIDMEGNVRDLTGHVDDLGGATLTAVGLAKIAAIDPNSLPLVKEPGRLGPCVTRTGKFICVGLNYADHAAETGAAIPSEPILF